MEQEKKKEVVNRLRMFLKDDNLVAEYIQSFGFDINMKKINDIKIDNTKTFDEKASAMYKIEVKCPICSTITDCYELKSKSLTVKENRFKVPFYYSSSNYEAIDFNKYRVTVCPKCFFASPDKKDFSRFNPFLRKEETSQISKIILQSIDADANNRIAILNNDVKIKNSFNRYPRTIRSTVFSYKLAIARVIQEEKHMLANAYLKHGGYIMRLIKLSKEMGENDDKILSLYVEAFHVFRDGFEQSNFTSKDFEMYNLYLLIATLIFIGRKDDAFKYKSKVPVIIEECGNDQKLLKEVLKWENEIKQLFEYIDELKSWDEPRR